jgi:Methyltransferase domain
MRQNVQRLLLIIDYIILPFVYPAAWLFKNIRKAGIHRFPLCRSALFRIGVFPIREHYYEPQFNYKDPIPNFSADRNINGIDWNVSGQLELLNLFNHSNELTNIPQEKINSLSFHFNNGTFESGDAEYWYQLIRHIKPKRIVEIGSGNSTLIAISALRLNQYDNPLYQYEHTCIEPYEMPWLEETGVTVIRKKVEDMHLSFFKQLQENDILFIDSSHIIRPQGDVVFEYLELLPSLNKGVIVHVHDIFSPKNYPEKWIKDEVLFWNEQYLLEAFLIHNTSWKIIGAVNFLHHNYYHRLSSVAPYLTPNREPGSFYIQKIA